MSARAQAQSAPADDDRFKQLFSRLIQAEGAEYVAAREEFLRGGEKVKEELLRMATSDQSTWQERALSRGLLVRLASSSERLAELEEILSTGVLPRWARPLRIEYDRNPRSLNYDELPEKAFEPPGSIAYISKIGFTAIFPPTRADVTLELLWKGLITKPECCQSVLGALARYGVREDHEAVVGVAQAVFNRAGDSETQRVALGTVGAHVGPARQRGWAVKRPVEVIKWLAEIARDSTKRPELRATAVKAMGGTAEPAANEPALEYLWTDNPLIRSAAVKASGHLLSGLGYPNPGRMRIVEALEGVLNAVDHSSTLAKEITDALTMVNGRVDPDVARKAVDVLETYVNRVQSADHRFLKERIRLIRSRIRFSASRPAGTRN